MAWLSQGCATVAEGNDPKVVHAERTLDIAFTTVNTFLRLEREHDDWTTRNAPRVHAIAETLRRKAPPVFRAASDAIRSYKRDGGLAALETALGDVQQVAAQATMAMADLNPGGTR